ncbi:hypothetical protein HD554DRAFT_2125014 [Boletus coccyginus]|nr:hypothetical protein HD554DRAFT_2125014 [Boletus coccyginus]
MRHACRFLLLGHCRPGVCQTTTFSAMIAVMSSCSSQPREPTVSLSSSRLGWQVRASRPLYCLNSHPHTVNPLRPPYTLNL